MTITTATITPSITANETMAIASTTDKNLFFTTDPVNVNPSALETTTKLSTTTTNSSATGFWSFQINSA
jgi:hypothetical protein